MKGIAAALLCTAGLALAGCTNARVGVGTPEAAIYKNVTVPLNAGIDRRTGDPMVIPETLAVGTSSGYALDFSIPGLEFTRPISIGWGNMSLEKALANGNLERVSYADGQEITILRIFKKARIIAYGPLAAEE
jgi:hypothetical protein